MMSYIARFSLVAICFFSLSLDFDMTKLLKKRVHKEVSKVFMCSDFKLNEDGNGAFDSVFPYFLNFSILTFFLQLDAKGPNGLLFRGKRDLNPRPLA